MFLKRNIARRILRQPDAQKKNAPKELNLLVMAVSSSSRSVLLDVRVGEFVRMTNACGASAGQIVILISTFRALTLEDSTEVEINDMKKC